ncbi:putative quinone oxidoreductase, YhdH/YhfP family [Deinococcus reticulitermitis]|uniref:Putative quinone oxidoreductase, YhdH/YhfP family n=1 Tax=Deinococcus reticulitermitis TaxID=856736 RepID=A0A1H6T265_9DEIO|nr:MDR family oxidoreductase [Deinococcus reticulitermitis]SEI70360.1 putative quinone oxidoreductase, YhdH/YhfP family [Deinococcus reticulitermitis]
MTTPPPPAHPAVPATFRALRMLKDDSGIHHEFQQLTPADLGEGDTLVRVRYSSLNYKDGLAVAGKPGVLRSYPITPGIDLAGEVISCETGEYQPGDGVVLTGWGIGERVDGGYSELARVRAEWLVPLPGGVDARWAMSVGTAGFTAMLAVLALEGGGVTPERGEVLVTGAAGGVGSTAVSLLATAGFTVAASTGRPEEEAYLRSLGASVILPREEVPALKRPLEKERWAGVVDTVGGATLAGAIASTRTHGVVAACGLAGGSDLPTTVFPFILRGVTLAGIDSVTCPAPRRRAAWERLARDLPPRKLGDVTRVRPLDDLPELAEEILAGRVRGRTVIEVSPA